MIGIIGPGILASVAAVLKSRGWLEEETRCPQEVANALRKFQRWAGLDETMELDRETLAELDEPRFCALPDVLALNATMCKWPDGSIPYYVFDAFPGLTLEATWQAFDWAMALWAGAAKLKPSRAANAANARILARVKRIDGPSGVLAQSQLPCGAIRQAMQDYDSSEAWNVQVQARLVIAHELGHALGLDHAPGKGSLMSPYYDSAITKLQRWDVDEIVKRYGAATAAPAPLPPPSPANSQILIDVASKSVIAPSGWTVETR